jgi:hypothetical protein
MEARQMIDAGDGGIAFAFAKMNAPYSTAWV